MSNNTSQQLQSNHGNQSTQSNEGNQSSQDNQSSNQHNNLNDCTELSDAELMRYSRQILLNGWDVDAQLRLKSSHVLIVGVGGLGCPVSEILVRSGVGHIHLLDHDVIEASNLQRQTLFHSNNLGQLKAQVACDALMTMNEFIQVTFEVNRFEDWVCDPQHHGQNASQIPDGNSLQSFDLVLDCTDNFATRDMINQFCVQQQVPLLSASAIATNGQLALFEASKATGCYHCIFAGEGGDEQSCTTSGVLTSTTMVMASLQANVALRYLGLGVNPLAGKLLLWDGIYMTQRMMHYQQNQHCRICGKW